MKWYLAKLVFRIICGEGNHTPQFDEQLRLICTVSRDVAFEKAVMLGTTGTETFYNQKQQLVQWQFVNVSELYLLTELIDGAEIYSRIQEVDDADAYAEMIHVKAHSIMNSMQFVTPQFS